MGTTVHAARERPGEDWCVVTRDKVEFHKHLDHALARALGISRGHAVMLIHELTASPT
jgi:hypothetical protein